MSNVSKDVQQVWKESFDTYAKCEDYLEYWIKTYGETDTVNSFSITKVADNDWRLIILYSQGVLLRVNRNKRKLI